MSLAGSGKASDHFPKIWQGFHDLLDDRDRAISGATSWNELILLGSDRCKTDPRKALMSMVPHILFPASDPFGVKQNGLKSCDSTCQALR